MITVLQDTAKPNSDEGRSMSTAKKTRYRIGSEDAASRRDQ